MAVEKVLQEALALPPEERARVVDALISSLEPKDEQVLTETEWEAAWHPEIERRLRDLDEGRATTISYEEFKERVRARLPSP
jgi:putative addiction module component (TIGR02574 family)